MLFLMIVYDFLCLEALLLGYLYFMLTTEGDYKKGFFEKITVQWHDVAVLLFYFSSELHHFLSRGSYNVCF